MAEDDSENLCPSKRSLINARDNPLSRSLPFPTDCLGIEVEVLIVRDGDGADDMPIVDDDNGSCT